LRSNISFLALSAQMKGLLDWGEVGFVVDEDPDVLWPDVDFETRDRILAFCPALSAQMKLKTDPRPRFCFVSLGCY
jgi:hypothetical protein